MIIYALYTGDDCFCLTVKFKNCVEKVADEESMKLNRPQVAFLWSCTSGYDVDFPVRLHYAIQKPRLYSAVGIKND